VAFVNSQPDAQKTVVDSPGMFVNGLTDFSTFGEAVQSSIDGLAARDSRVCGEIHHLLNGGAFEALKAAVPRSERQKYGMYFTCQKLAHHVASKIRHKIVAGATFADPTCGAGDLLLACLLHAPVAQTCNQTIKSWAKVVSGIELHSELAEVTRKRIRLLAASRSKNLSNQDCRKYALDIRAGNFLETPEALSKIDCIVMNPPFGAMKSNKIYPWFQGSVQQAAVFVWELLCCAKTDQEIVAILPDVLRSGSRYAKWRTEIELRAQIQSIESLGKFNNDTDVDVFLLHLRKGAPTANASSKRWDGADELADEQIRRLGDAFKVSVGTVVPYRAQEVGQMHHYLDVASAPAHSTIGLLRQRRFQGNLHRGPFVVLRRTSSPSDQRRIVASLYPGTDEVAVENHLIVLQPQDQTVLSCLDIMKKLDAPNIDEWINKRTRCRHLTTQIIKLLPIGNAE
jgi:predicted RNA methylase